MKIIVAIETLADGGEGTCRAIIAGLGGVLKSVEVTDPLDGKVLAEFGEVPEKIGGYEKGKCGARSCAPGFS